jgi:hypothetical protein
MNQKAEITKTSHEAFVVLHGAAQERRALNFHRNYELCNTRFLS